MVKISGENLYILHHSSVWNKLYLLVSWCLFHTEVIFILTLGSLLEGFVCCTWKKWGWAVFCRCLFTIALPQKQRSKKSSLSLYGWQFVNELINLVWQDCMHHIFGAIKSAIVLSCPRRSLAGVHVCKWLIVWHHERREYTTMICVLYFMSHDNVIIEHLWQLRVKCLLAVQLKERMYTLGKTLKHHRGENQENMRRCNIFCIRLHVGVLLCIFFTVQHGQCFFKYIQRSESLLRREMMKHNPSFLVSISTGWKTVTYIYIYIYFLIIWPILAQWSNIFLKLYPVLYQLWDTQKSTFVMQSTFLLTAVIHTCSVVHTFHETCRRKRNLEWETRSYALMRQNLLSPHRWKE